MILCIPNGHESNLRFIFFRTDSAFLSLNYREKIIPALTFKGNFDICLETNNTKLD